MAKDKNPLELVKITWLDACSHGNADMEQEGIIRETVGWMVRRGRDVIRLSTTVDRGYDGKWIFSDQANDIIDIPHGMIVSIKKLREYGNG